MELGPYSVSAWLDWSPAHQLFSDERGRLVYRLLPTAEAPVKEQLLPYVRQLLAALSEGHPALPPVVESHLSDTEHLLVVDDLPSRRTLRLTQGIAPALALGLASHLLESLMPLHEQGLFHGALTPTRIYLDEAGEPVIFDTGAAYLSDAFPEQRLTPSVPGFSQLYPIHALVPPEIFLRRPLSPASDVFIVAALTFRWLSGFWAHGEGRAMEVYARLRDGRREPLPTLPGGLDLAALRIIDDALEPQPENRPSAEALTDALRPFANIPLERLTGACGEAVPYIAGLSPMSPQDAPGPPGSEAEERRQQAITRATLQLEMMRQSRPEQGGSGRRTGLVITFVVLIALAVALPMISQDRTRARSNAGPAFAPEIDRQVDPPIADDGTDRQPTGDALEEARVEDQPREDEPLVLTTDEPIEPVRVRRRTPSDENRVVRRGLSPPRALQGWGP